MRRRELEKVVTISKRLMIHFGKDKDEDILISKVILYYAVFTYDSSLALTRLFIHNNLTNP